MTMIAVAAVNSALMVVAARAELAGSTAEEKVGKRHAGEGRELHFPVISSPVNSSCSLSLWRVARGSKHMFLELIHGLFIT